MKPTGRERGTSPERLYSYWKQRFTPLLFRKMVSTTVGSRTDSAVRAGSGSGSGSGASNSASKSSSGSGSGCRTGSGDASAKL